MTETAQPQSEIPVPVLSKNEKELELDKLFYAIKVWEDEKTWEDQDPLTQATYAPPRPQGTKLDFDRLGFDTMLADPSDEKNKKKIRKQVSDEERVTRKQTWLDIYGARLELAGANNVIWKSRDEKKSPKEVKKTFQKLEKDQNTTFLAYNSKLRWNETKKKTPEDIEKARKKRELKKKGEKTQLSTAENSTAPAADPQMNGSNSTQRMEVRDPATGKSMLFEFRVFTQ
jgi:hypothetical protein